MLRARILALGALMVAALARAGAPDAALWCSARAPAAQSDFTRETDAAMARMVAAMEVEPSGDADRDFAAQMIAHHQGAIEMAEAELRHGRSEPLRRLAQEIVVEQQAEIAAMRLALESPR